MVDTWGALRAHVGEGIPEAPPSAPTRDDSVEHAPARRQVLTDSERRLALHNALRYFPPSMHELLAPEFADELCTHGRIYMHRFRPTEYDMRAHPLDAYPARCRDAAAIMLMIQNNLDSEVAQFPHELITYGGNGAVFQNWAQYRLTMRYLSLMTDSQTLVIYSGHPLGLFPSHPSSPRVVVTNGLVVPNHSSQDDYERFNALGVSQYGQMTAGSYMYIGPQGIVHGTTITLLNAARRYLGLSSSDGLAGVTFVTSGLGGMSGAQAKAAVIAGAACLIAEVNPAAVAKRHSQGWLEQVSDDLDDAIDRLLLAAEAGQATSIGYVGNIVDLWERLHERGVSISLGSDQTSLHNPYQGGYFPAGINIDDALQMMVNEPDKFKDAVQLSLRRQASAINSLCDGGMHFWDYGNAFLLEADRAGANVRAVGGGFRHPSYVEDIMGPMCFDYGFGPFRWVCCSRESGDLEITDNIAAEVLESLASTATQETRQQLLDNLHWIRDAASNDLVVGSMARILYADGTGRMEIASAFNTAVKDGRLSGPIVLGRDHHDVGGTDSPYRETADIMDGSMFTADMAIHNFVGDAFRGATWVSLHNGGGVGWGEVINGGFGMVLDGSDEAEGRLRSMLSWDVNNGIARRSWARNKGAEYTARQVMQEDSDVCITLPHHADEELVNRAFND